MIFTNKLLNASIILFGIYNIYNYYNYINHKLIILDTKYTTVINKYDMLYNNLNKMIMDLYNNYYILHKQINNNNDDNDKNNNDKNNNDNNNNDNELSYMRVD